MELVTQAMAAGILGGTLGGIASFILLSYDSFRKIPDTAPSQDVAIRNQRIYFFIFRMTFGAITGFIFSFWLMDRYATGEITISKFFFYSSLSGFTTNFLTILTGILKKIA
uniref:hypothetical protein n=1 Tax=Xanthomonas sp. 0924 TaxID=2835534 RepID=UPI003F81C922